MKSLFIFLIKQYWAFIFLCLIGTFLGLYIGILWSFLPVIFLFLFIYEWNIVPKKERTWYFFESFPISFFSRYFIRVIVPWIFSFFIIFSLIFFKENNSDNVVRSILDSLRITSLFVLSSILAHSMIGFLVWTIFCYFFCYLFSDYIFYEIAIIICCLSFSYYYLSESRISKIKSLFIPIFSSIIFLMSVNYFQIEIYRGLLSIPIHPVQTYAVENLLEKKAFVGKNFAVDWMYNGSDINNSAAKILIPSKYDDDLLEKMEFVLFKENICLKNCQLLANYVAYFPKNWNLDRIQFYLFSDREAQQMYALMILDGAMQPLFLNRVNELTNSSNKNIRSLAITLISKWESDNSSLQNPNFFVY